MGNRFLRGRTTLETHPDISSIKTGAELIRWYWRKDELVSHARALGLKTTSGKFTILERIAHYLDTGEVSHPLDKAEKSSSKFKWHSEPLSSSTIITDNYKNSQNVRSFFQAEVGPEFKFNIAFMDWMKDNVGRTLGDACEAYVAMRAQENVPGYKTKIKSHNQFNQYTRDFLQDNPKMGMEDVRKTWALKIQRPSQDGRHVYDRSDLKMK